MKELTPFENELISLLKNIKFKNVRNPFQDELQQDLKRMKASNKTMTFTDRPTNIYHLTREEYEKIINNSITATYKKASTTSRRKSLFLGTSSCITTKF